MLLRNVKRVAGLNQGVAPDVAALLEVIQIDMHQHGDCLGLVDMNDIDLAGVRVGSDKRSAESILNAVIFLVIVPPRTLHVAEDINAVVGFGNGQAVAGRKVDVVGHNRRD